MQSQKRNEPKKIVEGKRKSHLKSSFFNQENEYDKTKNVLQNQYILIQH